MARNRTRLCRVREPHGEFFTRKEAYVYKALKKRKWYILANLLKEDRTGYTLIVGELAVPKVGLETELGNLGYTAVGHGASVFDSGAIWL